MKSIPSILLLALAAACADAHAAPPPAGRSPAHESADPGPARRAVERLWPALESGHLSLPDWEQAARAAGGGLGREAAPELLRILADDHSTPLERVAAAELFRRLPGRDGAPSAADLARLRRAAFGGLPGSALAGPARRALVDLGDWSDRLRLVNELETAEQPEVRQTAAWCLQGLGTHEVSLDLARLLGPGSEARAAELAAATLEHLVRSCEPPADALRAALVERALAALDAPFCPAALEQHLCALLGQLDDARARGRLEFLAREGREHAARVLAASDAGRRRLAEIARDPRTGQAGRLAAGEALRTVAGRE